VRRPLVVVSVSLCSLLALGACDSPERVRQRPGETLPPLRSTVAVRRATTTAVTVIPTYVVQAGDNLQAIANRLGVDINDLAALNGILDRNQIAEGSVLVVPTTTIP